MNSNRFRRWTRRLGAAVTVLALSVAGAVAIAPAANAASIGDITGTTGTLTIHKHGADPGAPGNGTQLTPAPALPLSGVTFSVQRVANAGVPLDLTTTQGWNLAAPSGTALTPAQAQTAPYSVAASGGPGYYSVTTIADGTATLTNLPYGLYLVTETGVGSNPVVSRAQPFLVSVPYPTGTVGSPANSWIYDVHVYPKNKLNTTVPTKTVSDPGTPVLGETVNWTITAPVPPLAVGGAYNTFIVRDTIDSRLTVTGVTVTIDGVATTDFTVTPAGASNGPIVVTLNDPNTKLAGKAGKNVVVTVTTRVDSLGSDGKITNIAIVNVNDSSITTNPSQTNWGPAQIVKTNASNPGQTLQGAQFEVWTAKENGTKVLGPLTTNANGQINIAGLWVGSDSTTLSRDYWIKEIQAPAGYITPAGDAAWTKVTVRAGGAGTPVTVTVANTQQPGPILPLTGSTGTALFVIVGLVLVGVGVGTFAYRRIRAAHR